MSVAVESTILFELANFSMDNTRKEIENRRDKNLNIHDTQGIIKTKKNQPIEE